jgi:hypothetical protein
MAANVHRIADRLGAKVMTQVPDTGGGAFGAARLAQVVATLQARLVPAQGRRTGRPTDATWVHHPKIPMSEATGRRLVRLADRASAEGRKVSPMQLAAQILEDAVAALPEV